MTPKIWSALSRASQHGMKAAVSRNKAGTICFEYRAIRALQSPRSLLTKGVPKDQSQLRNLLPFLAKLQKGSLPGIFIEKVNYVLQCAAVLLRRNRHLQRVILGVARCEGIHVIVGARDAIVVLLLGHVGGGGSGLGMVLVRVLLVHPGRVGLWILMVSVDVRVWHHLCDEGRRRSGRQARSLG